MRDLVLLRLAIIPVLKAGFLFGRPRIRSKENGGWRIATLRFSLA
jgi:hypothetical protein